MADLATDIMSSLPHPARRALSALEDAGYETWVVGGFVRDALRGCAPADVDFATAAPWQAAQAVCEAAGAHVIPTGAKHGTVTAVFDGTPLEITTFRVDGAYTDGRHPDSVSTAASIEEDLARRDFTINAIALHPERGILDPFDGCADLESGIIRTVGDPHLRFHEDALRILRACRFSAQLDFAIDDATRGAMTSSRHLLMRISHERVAHELTRLLVGANPKRALIECADVIGAVLPELVSSWNFEQHSPYHCFDVYEHTAWVVQYAPAEPTLRWAALLHDVGKPALFFKDANGQGHFYGHAILSAQLASGALARLRMPRKLVDDVVALVRHHDDEIAPTAQQVGRFLRKHGWDPSLFQLLCHLKRADALAHAPEHQDGAATAGELSQALSELLASRAPLTTGDLAVNGRDVMELGIPEGPAVGAALSHALDAVMEGSVPNDRASLLAYLRAWCDDAHR